MSLPLLKLKRPKQLIFNTELDLKVTTPNTVKFVNCCYYYHITYNEIENGKYKLP